MENLPITYGQRTVPARHTQITPEKARVCPWGGQVCSPGTGRPWQGLLGLGCWAGERPACIERREVSWRLRAHRATSLTAPPLKTGLLVAQTASPSQSLPLPSLTCWGRGGWGPRARPLECDSSALGQCSDLESVPKLCASVSLIVKAMTRVAPTP